MLDVNVSINAIITYCNESVLGLNLGNGYTIVKAHVDDLPIKDKITDGRGRLTIDYFKSVKCDDTGKYLFCLRKSEVYQIENPITGPGVYTGDTLSCREAIEKYNDAENKYLHKIFSLLHLFGEGNIGTKQIFLDHCFSIGILKNKINHTIDNVTRNTTDQREYSLTESEVIECNQFLTDYAGAEFELLKDCINEFVWGLEQIDDATGFEQFTTALEMTLLGHNQQGKKEVLSKRVAVLLGKGTADITQLYRKMKDFYRYRSESLHEGDAGSISATERLEMERIVRSVLNSCLRRCKAELVAAPSISWSEIKAKIINDLKLKVIVEENAGAFT